MTDKKEAPGVSRGLQGVYPMRKLSATALTDEVIL